MMYEDTALMMTHLFVAYVVEWPPLLLGVRRWVGEESGGMVPK